MSSSSSSPAPTTTTNEANSQVPQDKHATQQINNEEPVVVIKNNFITTTDHHHHHHHKQSLSKVKLLDTSSGKGEGEEPNNNNNNNDNHHLDSHVASTGSCEQRQLGKSSLAQDSELTGALINRSTEVENLQSSSSAAEVSARQSAAAAVKVQDSDKLETSTTTTLKRERDLSEDKEPSVATSPSSATTLKPMVYAMTSSGGDGGGGGGQEQLTQETRDERNENLNEQQQQQQLNNNNLSSIVDINNGRQLANHHHHHLIGSDNKCLPETVRVNVTNEEQQQQEIEEEFQKNLSAAATATETLEPKRLSYCQSLLLRKWPCLALTICIMSSLIFAIILSALTIYLLHDVANNSCTGAMASTQSHNYQHHNPSSGGGGAELAALDAAIIDSLAVPPIDSIDLLTPTTTGKRILPPAHLLGATAGSELVTAKQQVTFTRLPQSLEPLHYNLFVWPLIAQPFNFSGSVEIYLRCKQATDNITLHTLDLALNETTIKLIKLSVPVPEATGEPLAPRRRRRFAANLTAARVANTTPADQKLGDRIEVTGSGGKSAGAAVPAENTGRVDEELKVKSLSQNKRLQYSIIHLNEQLEQGRDYLLKLDFVGHLNDDLAGFYKIKYERADTNQINWIAATQFQATDARRAFPCFDEPHFKATFSIKIKHWKNMTALSNMPITQSEQSADGFWITDTFAKSQRMSTYLVAWAVTNFESRTDGNITVWARPGSLHAAEYALQVAGKILRHYEDFFGIEYPLPKMDMIALPDFNAGAMENWGLITYRETAMLWDESTSALSNKQRVATVVAHELAHQWFGNLVTPKWWDDLWLNEGFASYVEYIGVNFVEPKWKMLDQFVLEELQDVLSMDSLSSTHRISVPVNDPDEISEIFDHISYSKGASIIRMMMNFIGENVFKLGLQRYLRALKYNNAEQADLWVHLNDAQRILANNNTQLVDVASVMNSWTLQAGYPLVTLKRLYDKNDNNQNSSVVLGTLEQVRFKRFSMPSVETTTATERWEIPITFTWQSEQNWEPKTRLWMHANASNETRINETTQQLVDINRSLAPNLTSNQWIILNTQAVGYYRVNYDSRNWKLLIDQLQLDHSKISTINRAQILNDLFELARSSVVNYTLALEATKYLKDERQFLPWSAVLEQIAYINEMLVRTPLFGHWEDYFGKLIAPLYARYKDIEWTRPINNKTTAMTTNNNKLVEPYDENDAHELYTHIFAVSGACQTKDPHCLAKLSQVFGQFKSTGVNNIKPALRITIYCAAMRRGTKGDWDFLMREHERTQSSTERARIIYALGCSQEMWILSRYLDIAFNKTGPIRRQDTATVFRTIANNNYGRDLAFNYLRENWSTIKENFGASSFNLGYMVRGVGALLNTQTDLDQFKMFYESVKGDLGTSKRSFLNSIEEVESNVIWRNKNYKILADWLQSNRQQSQATN